MNDIIPPRQKVPAGPSQKATPRQVTKPQVAPVSSVTTEPEPSPKKPSRRKRLLIGVCALIILVVAGLLGTYAWYEYNLSPLSTKNTTKQRFEVASGESPHQIAKALQSQHIIRSADAFYFYLVQSGDRDHLQAGVYALSPSQSVSTIVGEMVKGAVDEVSITFYPGAVLDKGPKGSGSTSVVTVLQKAGYASSQISAALAASYDEPALFAGRPGGSSLEGYVFGDTYRVYASASAADVIKKSLDEFSAVVTTNNLAADFQAQGLTLYQGITLASIIQREVSNPDDQKVVAQIFLSRLQQGMPLGSDVTYQYGAAQLGVAPSVDLNSPYNTRVVTGLPPGPISSPGLSALLAVAHPASTSYLYFLSGDDGKTYFANTDAEQQANIVAHCQQKCSEV